MPGPIQSVPQSLADFILPAPRRAHSYLCFAGRNPEAQSFVHTAKWQSPDLDSSTFISKSIFWNYFALLSSRTKKWGRLLSCSPSKTQRRGTWPAFSAFGVSFLQDWLSLFPPRYVSIGFRIFKLLTVDKPVVRGAFHPSNNFSFIPKYGEWLCLGHIPIADLMDVIRDSGYSECEAYNSTSGVESEGSSRDWV